ncbi:unnamed protein product [Sphagnum jensenii]|uniref:EamA domain-containing protein n=1 Tax=Sphagnum jensenii TaxID=128206 RepID=A0ABP0WJV5_9BRYO
MAPDGFWFYKIWSFSGLLWLQFHGRRRRRNTAGVGLLRACICQSCIMAATVVERSSSPEITTPRSQDYALALDGKTAIILPSPSDVEGTVIPRSNKVFDSQTSRSRASAKPVSPTIPSRSIFVPERSTGSAPTSPSTVNSELAPLIPNVGGSRSIAIDFLPLSVPSLTASVQSVKRHFLLGSSSASAAKERRTKLRSPVVESAGLPELLAWIWGGSRYSGPICMALAALAYTLMGVLVEFFAVQEMPLYETQFFRCAVVSAAAAVVTRVTGHSLFGARHLLAARAIMGLIASSGFIYSLSVLPLSAAASINFSTPLFTALLSTIILQEPWNPRVIAGTPSSLVYQPAFAPSDGASSDDKRYLQGASMSLAFVAAAIGGAVYCCIRSLGKAGEPPQVTVFAFAALSCPIAALCALLFQDFVLPGFVDLIGMVITGITAFAAQVLVARGLQLEKAARATSFLYIEVVSSYLLHAFLLGYVPSLYATAGIILVTLNICSLLFWENEQVPG